MLFLQKKSKIDISLASKVDTKLIVKEAKKIAEMHLAKKYQK